MKALRTGNRSGPVDFIIVGAGPVGLVTAILLGREGWRVTVIEKWPARYAMPRACTIDHEALRILQGIGLMRDHSDLFEPSRGERGGYQIRNGDGTLLRAINWNRPAESGWANTNGFYQPDLESVLEAMAEAIPSVVLRRGWTAEAIDQNDESVTLGIESTADRSLTDRVQGRWLIGADGANSAVRSLVEIETIDTGFEADWLVIDYQPLDNRPWEAFVTQYCDPLQPATAVNSGPGRRRFEFMRRADVSVEELGTPETAWRLMAPFGVTPETARLERHAVYTFRGRWATNWRRGRVILAGDSAHLMPPFLGQGLCSGLRDARSLAWRLSMIQSGLATQSILDSYSSERGGHVREIIAEAVTIGELICELDPQKAAERDERLRAELNDPNKILVEPPHPRLGMPSITDDPVVAGDDSVVRIDSAGRLSIQAQVEADGVRGLFDDIVGGSWQLIALDADPLAQVPAELQKWFASIGGTATAISRGGSVRDVDGGYREWFDAHDCQAVLSRPDFYIYGTGGPADIPRLLNDLRDTLGGIPARTRQPSKEGALS